MSLAYNIAVMLFGGYAQFIVTWLINVTASPVAPVFYVIFGAAVGLLGAILLVDPVIVQRRADEALHNLKKVEG
jgi:MFS transporter, MHS family, proline/betaine transporter